MDATVSFNASVTIDGELRSVSGSEAISVDTIVTGLQTVGTAYERLAFNSQGNYGVLLYNAGAVEVAVRIRFAIFTSSEYMTFSIPAGGVMMVPSMYHNEGILSYWEDLYARSLSATSTIEYCHLV